MQIPYWSVRVAQISAVEATGLQLEEQAATGDAGVLAPHVAVIYRMIGRDLWGAIHRDNLEVAAYRKLRSRRCIVQNLDIRMRHRTWPIYREQAITHVALSMPPARLLQSYPPSAILSALSPKKMLARLTPKTFLSV